MVMWFLTLTSLLARERTHPKYPVWQRMSSEPLHTRHVSISLVKSNGTWCWKRRCVGIVKFSHRTSICSRLWSGSQCSQWEGLCCQVPSWGVPDWVHHLAQRWVPGSLSSFAGFLHTWLSFRWEGIASNESAVHVPWWDPHNQERTKVWQGKLHLCGQIQGPKSQKESQSQSRR